MTPVFLSLAEVLGHRDQIERYGGYAGLRDLERTGTVAAIVSIAERY